MFLCSLDQDQHTQTPTHTYTLEKKVLPVLEVPWSCVKLRVYCIILPLLPTVVFCSLRTNWAASHHPGCQVLGIRWSQRSGQQQPDLKRLIVLEHLKQQQEALLPCQTHRPCPQTHRPHPQTPRPCPQTPRPRPQTPRLRSQTLPTE